jgi:segregation and condensation protein B
MSDGQDDREPESADTVLSVDGESVNDAVSSEEEEDPSSTSNEELSNSIAEKVEAVPDDDEQSLEGDAGRTSESSEFAEGAAEESETDAVAAAGNEPEPEPREEELDPSSPSDSELTDSEVETVESVPDDHEQPLAVALSQPAESSEFAEGAAEESETDAVAAAGNEPEPEPIEEEEDPSSPFDGELTDSEVETVESIPDDHEQPLAVALSQPAESSESVEGVAEESETDAVAAAGNEPEPEPIEEEEGSSNASDDEMAGGEEGVSTDRKPEVALAAQVDGLLLLAETTFQEQTKSEGGAVSTEMEPEPESAQEEAPELSPVEIQASLEAVLYAAGEPLTLREMKKVLSDVPPERVKQGIESLLETYSSEGRGLHIVQVAGGYQVTTRPEYHERVSAMFKAKPPTKLTIQALETLASIAYRQPVTVPEIMELRGVRSASVVRTLLERKLIRIVGRKNVVGRPLLYGTTKDFLVRFGLKDLNELPRLEDIDPGGKRFGRFRGESRRILITSDG